MRNLYIQPFKVYCRNMNYRSFDAYVCFEFIQIQEDNFHVPVIEHASFVQIFPVLHSVLLVLFGQIHMRLFASGALQICGVIGPSIRSPAFLALLSLYDYRSNRNVATCSLQFIIFCLVVSFSYESCSINSSSSSSSYSKLIPWCVRLFIHWIAIQMR